MRFHGPVHGPHYVWAWYLCHPQLLPHIVVRHGHCHSSTGNTVQVSAGKSVPWGGKWGMGKFLWRCLMVVFLFGFFAGCFVQVLQEGLQEAPSSPWWRWCGRVCESVVVLDTTFTFPTWSHKVRFNLIYSLNIEVFHDKIFHCCRINIDMGKNCTKSILHVRTVPPPKKKGQNDQLLKCTKYYITVYSIIDAIGRPTCIGLTLWGHSGNKCLCSLALSLVYWRK